MPLYLELRLVDDLGRTQGVVRRQVDDHVAYRGERAAEAVRNPEPFGGVTFDDVVKVIQARELRRKSLRDITPMLGEALADFLYDREGWSDPDRQERVEQIARDDRR